jgi:hypothetical protein
MTVVWPSAVFEPAFPARSNPTPPRLSPSTAATSRSGESDRRRKLGGGGAGSRQSRSTNFFFPVIEGMNARVRSRLTQIL